MEGKEVVEKFRLDPMRDLWLRGEADCLLTYISALEAVADALPKIIRCVDEGVEELGGYCAHSWLVNIEYIARQALAALDQGEDQ